MTILISLLFSYQMIRRRQFHQRYQQLRIPEIKKSEIKRPKIKQQRKLSICSYNVHCFINLDGITSQVDNFKHILNMFRQLQANILILEEFVELPQIYEQFSDLGYTYYALVRNGCLLQDTEDLKSYVCVLAKQPFEARSIDLSVHNSHRECLYLEINGLTIMAIHLEIGDRFHSLPPTSAQRKKIIKNNTKYRLTQLKAIVGLKPNIIIGDCNFTPDDKEFRYLHNQGYTYLGDRQPTNPFNCCDLAFVRGSKKAISYHRIECNYSDHLPILILL